MSAIHLSHSMPSHHPAQAILESYARGRLDPVTSLVTETHIHFCAACRAQVTSWEIIGGLMIETIEPQAMSPGALDRALGALDQIDRQSQSAHQRGDNSLLNLPVPVRDLAIRAALGSGWKFAAPGVRTLDLDVPGDQDRRARGGAVQLIRIDAGGGVPRHSHTKQEWTLVLSGAFRDEAGRFGPGDLAVLEPGMTHRPIGEIGVPCMALIVTEAPVAFTGALGLVQRAWNRL